MSNTHDTRHMQAVFRFLIYEGIGALLAFVWLVLIPSDSKNAWVFGFSKSRFVLIIGMILVASIFFVIAWQFRSRKGWQERLRLVTDKIFKGYRKFWYWITWLVILVVGLCSVYLFQFRTDHTTVLAIMVRISPYLIFAAWSGIGLLVVSIVLYFPSVMDQGVQKSGTRFRYFHYVFFVRIINFFLVLGIFLMGINLYGSFQSMRNPVIYEEFSMGLTLENVYENLDQLPGESDEAYVYRLVDVAHSGVAHYWENDGIDRFHMRVPSYENHILYLGSLINPKRYLGYEFCNHRLAIERGVGLCSQYSLILTDILNERGFETRIAGLSGHVVATVQIDAEEDIWWTIDGDNGFVFEYPIEVIEKNPEIIREYFEGRGGYRPEVIDLFVEIYGEDGNYIKLSGNEFDGGGKCTREQAFYILKWLFPILSTLPALIYYLRKRYRLPEKPKS